MSGAEDLGAQAMSCIGSSIPSLDAFAAAIERCGREYGGENWASQAMIGGATVLIFVFILVILWVTLQGLRR